MCPIESSHSERQNKPILAIVYLVSCPAAKYFVLEQGELPEVSGGGLLDVFDRVTAYTFQNQFLGSMRTAVWNCLLQKSLQPTVDWAKDFWQMSLLRKATFLYGGVRLGQTVANYWKM